MNDISKDHPELVLKIAKKWAGQSENTDWILKRALRTLLKSGNQSALKIFGSHESGLDVKIQNLKLTPNKLSIGASMHFEFALKIASTDKSKTNLRVEYAIYFQKKSGAKNKKVFMIKDKLAADTTTIPIVKKHSFREMTTRKHYPGSHSLEIIVNGIARKKVDFLLIKKT